MERKLNAREVKQLGKMVCRLQDMESRLEEKNGNSDTIMALKSARLAICDIPGYWGA